MSHCLLLLLILLPAISEILSSFWKFSYSWTTFEKNWGRFFSGKFTTVFHRFLGKILEKISHLACPDNVAGAIPDIHRCGQAANLSQHTRDARCWWPQCAAAASLLCCSSIPAARSSPVCTAAPGWSYRSRSLPQRLSPGGSPPCRWSTQADTERYGETDRVPTLLMTKKNRIFQNFPGTHEKFSRTFSEPANV